MLSLSVAVLVEGKTTDDDVISFLFGIESKFVREKTAAVYVTREKKNRALINDSNDMRINSLSARDMPIDINCHLVFEQTFNGK